MPQETVLQTQVTREMERIFEQVPYGIAHTRRVLANAESIMSGEKPSGDLREVILLAVLLHDIGAVEAQRKYGSIDGQSQELEGRILARQILERLGADPALRERICFLVGHHHTPALIDGPDFQILWEADLLDNTEYGEHRPIPDGLEAWIQKNFHTGTGRQLARARLTQLQDGERS